MNEKGDDRDGKAWEESGISIGEGRNADEIDGTATFNKPLAVEHGEEDQLINLSWLANIRMSTLWYDEIRSIPDAVHTSQWE